MVISVASGKGGTGKTTLATNMALAFEDEVLFLDCDVEEPNSHLFLKPEIEKSAPVYVLIPQVDSKKCTFCGECGRICEYKAIIPVAKNVLVFPELCHSCGGCSLVCPEGAIREVNRQIGVIEQGQRGKVKFVHGRLNVGEPMSPPLIKKVKQSIKNQNRVIIDSPPGTSCPVVESIRGSDFCLLVTEPTPFGLNDLILAVGVAGELKIPCGVVINRSDGEDDEVEKYCQEENIPVLKKIPNDRSIAEAYSKGEMICEVLPQYKKAFQELLVSIEGILKK